jgi:hypothetical protein
MVTINYHGNKLLFNLSNIKLARFLTLQRGGSVAIDEFSICPHNRYSFTLCTYNLTMKNDHVKYKTKE